MLARSPLRRPDVALVHDVRAIAQPTTPARSETEVARGTDRHRRRDHRGLHGSGRRADNLRRHQLDAAAVRQPGRSKPMTARCRGAPAAGMSTHGTEHAGGEAALPVATEPAGCAKIIGTGHGRVPETAAGPAFRVFVCRRQDASARLRGHLCFSLGTRR
jgi:hypothetical protein